MDPTSYGSGDDATIKPRSSYYGSKPEAPREIGYNTPAVEKRPPVKSGSSPGEGSSHSFSSSYNSYNPVSSPVGSLSPPAFPSSAQGSSKPSAPMPGNLVFCNISELAAIQVTTCKAILLGTLV